MEIGISPEDAAHAPDQGNNGSLVGLGDFVHNPLLSADSKDALRAFIQHGRTHKEEATRLFNFCHSPDFSWFDDEDSTSTSNNAALRPMEPCDSTHMSASSSSSSENPPTQPQTPTLTNNSSIGLEYHLPDDGDVALETFLLWLLGSQPRRIPHKHVKKLYDMSRLHGHGTDEGFQALIDAADSSSKKTEPATPIAAPGITAELKSPNSDSPPVEQQSVFPQGLFPLSYQQGQLLQPYQHSHGNLLVHQARVDHSRSLISPFHYGALMQSAPVPVTLQQGSASAQQFVAPAALSRMDGNYSLISPATMSQPSMLLGDSGHRDIATSPAAQPSVVESPPAIMAPQSSRQSGGFQSITAHVSPQSPETATSSASAGDSNNKTKLTCPIAKDCGKVVEADNSTNAFKFLIEHIRRVHPDNHIQHLPSTKESVEKMVNMEVAVCTLLENGQQCDFRLAGQKGQRSPWRQALDHVREAHPKDYISDLPANKSSFVAMMKGGPVERCPFQSKDGTPCPKICVGPKVYRSIIEHVRRAHEAHYSKQPSTKEGWDEILRRNGISTATMQRSLSNDSSSSGHSLDSQASQRQSVPQQLQIPSVPRPVHAPAIVSGSSQISTSQVHGPVLIPADSDRIASPGGPREFVRPYMLQHEGGSMALCSVNGHAEPMTYDDQTGAVSTPYSTEQDGQHLGHAVNGRHLSMDGALKPCFGDSIQPLQQDPTLGRPLFPSLSDNIAEAQAYSTHSHSGQYGAHEQRHNHHVQAVQKQANSRQGPESSIRKRGREDANGVIAAGEGRPSKKISAHSQSVFLDNTARHETSGHSDFGGPVPSLTEEWFGLSLERLTDNPFSILTGPTITELTAGIPNLSRHQLREELMRRWPTAHKLATASTEDIMALLDPMGLGLEQEEQLREALLKLAKEYVKMPPTKDRRFGCENYPLGAVHNVIDDEVFEAEDKDIANEVHARDASWEIGHITKRHVAIDAWRIFCRDVLLGRAEDWKGTGAAPGFEPEWKRVSPEDPALRCFVVWLWMKEGVFWDPLTGVKQPLAELTRNAINMGRVHFNAQGQFFCRTSAGVSEPIDGSGTSPGMDEAQHMDGGIYMSSMGSMGTVPHSMSGALDGFMSGLPSSHDFAQSTTFLTSPVVNLGDVGDTDFLYGFSIPTDGPDSGSGISAFDSGVSGRLNGPDGILGGVWGSPLE